MTGPKTVVEAVAAGHNAADAAAAAMEGKTYEVPAIFNVSRGHWSSLEKSDLVFLREVSDAGPASSRIIFQWKNANDL